MDIYITDLIQEDYNEEESSASSESSNKYKTNEDNYLLRAFGRLDTGESVCIDITDFVPYFYIWIPQDWNKNILQIFISQIKNKVYRAYKDHLINYSIIYQKPFTHYTGDNTFKFLKLEFKSLEAFKKYDYLFRKPLTITGLNKGEPYKYDRYETNIPPLLRAIHNKDLNSIGWITITKYRQILHNDNIRTDKYYTVDYENVSNCARTDIPKIRFMSWDIEADSSHADFPIADKDYIKLSREILNEYYRLAKLTTKYKSDKDLSNVIKKYIQLAFNSNFNNNGVSYCGLDSKLFNFNYKIEDFDMALQSKNLETFIKDNYSGEIEDPDAIHNMSNLIILEIDRLNKQNNVRFKSYYAHVIKLLFQLSFDKDYINCNINNVFTIDNEKPTADTINKIMPQVISICKKYNLNIINKTKLQDEQITELNLLFQKHFPEVYSDPIIQIGSVFKKFGEKDPYLKHIITLNSCSHFNNDTLIGDENKDIIIPNEDIMKELNITNIEEEKRDEYIKEILNNRRLKQAETDKATVVIIECSTEEEVILEWIKIVKEQDPDIILGYNIFDFDYKYLYTRAQKLGIADEFNNIGKINWTVSREVAAGGMKKQGEELSVFKIQGLNSSAFGDNTLYYLQMFGRISIDMYKLAQITFKMDSYKLDAVCKKFLNKAKNDLPPSDIFIKQKGSDDDRALIAKYCLMDCILVQRLFDKLDIYITNCGMAQVCSVLFSYLFLRGQGIKLLSFVSKQCAKYGFLINVLDKMDPDEIEKYEGAIVLKPYKDIYFEPIAVADFNSLYPSCMISHNLSHDSYIGFKIINKGEDYTKLRGTPFDPDNKYECDLINGLYPGWDYTDIMYDIYEYKSTYKNGKEMKKQEKVIKAHKVCRFAQPPNGEKSVIPNILMALLKARKDTRKKQEDYKKGTFEWNVLEGLQLAYKTTANSLYGQIGSPTSAIRLIEISACTTSVGRSQIMFSRDFCHNNYPKSLVVYGDTDSIFIKFHTVDLYGNQLYGLDAVFQSMINCMEAGAAISSQLLKPHNLDFEKAIFPFMLISKKRYHGHYYTNPYSNKYYPNSMGIVLKRRDNAKIVKHVFGGMTDIIMTKFDLKLAIDYIKSECVKLLNGNFDLSYFILTKTLRSYYKDPTRISHNVLAQRIGKRDPGSKPRSNDRIAFAYIENQDKKALQGDRIETPDFITKNNLPIDYLFYLTNQIMKPVSQILDLKSDTTKNIFELIIIDYKNKKAGIKKMVPIKLDFTKKRPVSLFKKEVSPVKELSESDLEESDIDDFEIY